MKISLVISVYNSHGVVDRYTKYLKSLDLPKDIEFIFVDDGSDPPLEATDYDLSNFSIYKTNNKLAWAQGLGRNLGASKAKGEYLLMTDIDHIITKEAFNDVYNFKGTFMRFPRRFGVFFAEGQLKYDKESLRIYGLREKYLRSDIPATGVHNNTFAIKREVFEELGGYKKEWCNYGFHPLTGVGDDVYFGGMIRRYLKNKGLKQEMGSPVYVFPNGRFHKDGDKNPFGLFHDLSHKQEKFYKGDK